MRSVALSVLCFTTFGLILFEVSRCMCGDVESLRHGASKSKSAVDYVRCDRVALQAVQCPNHCDFTIGSSQSGSSRYVLSNKVSSNFLLGVNIRLLRGGSNIKKFSGATRPVRDNQSVGW